ncbi:alkane 1-monooxygenase [Salaquimonas pukyongi]|uniref:alkane 1-monooxygenase n=1 Tax=Salaquimonas pukyongi TaxID=2712698 RepID=UPI00096BCCBE|nr:alkane 1-monooxygenase [Salaquimonas pukyongi]
MIFIARSENGETVEYQDTKRWLWILSVLSPSVPLVGAIAMVWAGNPLWALFPLVFYFMTVPLLDAWFGEDNDNPPEAVVEALAADPYYRMLLFASIPVFYAGFLAAMYAAMQEATPWWAMVALVLGTGAASGAGITVGHELGHKPSRADQWGAKAILALTGYGHFPIEHNRGHHVKVATPEDPASARMGESVYRFALREIPGAARRAVALERERLARKGLPFLHWRNDILQAGAITAVIAGGLIAWLGVAVLPLLLLHHLVGWLQLTFANYVEHYGLLREKLPNGRYAPCEPRHSWNTNHIVSNLMLFHLQRHSDHHANPLRPYQTLRNFDELPRLPSGYPGSYVLAAIPPLWFQVMDPKVLSWAGGDISRTNHVPGCSTQSVS